MNLSGALPGKATILSLCLALGQAEFLHEPIPGPARGPVNPAIIPQDRLNEPWWAERHRNVLADVAAHPATQLLLLGDSITQNYEKANPPDQDFQPTWNFFYRSRSALNLGFSGDTTSNLLWRLNHGEVAALHPKAAVLLIGTNNTGSQDQSAEQTQAGILAVVDTLETLLPKTRILLVGILPSGISADKSQRDRDVNTFLASHYAGDLRVLYLDIGAIFYNDGVLNTDVFYDPRLPQHAKPLHPDTIGQRMMANAIEPALAHLLGDKPHRPEPPPESPAHR
jgi:lysophospholipase L1-like esterase